MTPHRWRFVLWFALVLLGPALLRADPTAHDLGGGLTYVRLPDLTEALPEAPGIVVLDLRYASIAPQGDTSALQEFLQAPRSLRLVLHDATPPAPLGTMLANRHASVVTLAPKGAVPEPDVAVAVEASADRAAYDALESGADLLALADPAPNKRRFDEAALVRARERRGQPAAGNAAAAAAVPDATSPHGAADANATADAPAPLVDALLQHAIRIARGLQALGRT